MKQKIISEIDSKLSLLKIPVQKANGADITINTEFLDAGWSTGSKKISYEASVLANEQDHVIYMYEKTTEVGHGLSFGGDSGSSLQSGTTLFRKVKSVQYGLDGKAYEYTLDLGAIPKAVKEIAKQYGWKFKTVLHKNLAIYPAGYVPTFIPAPPVTQAQSTGPDPQAGGSFCPNCGMPHMEGAKFCDKCGKPIEPMSQQQFTTPNATSVDQESQPQYDNPQGAVFAQSQAPVSKSKNKLSSKPGGMLFWIPWFLLLALGLLININEVSIIGIVLPIILLGGLLFFKNRLFKRPIPSIFIWVITYLVFLMVIGGTMGSNEKLLYSQQMTASNVEQVATYKGLTIKVPGGVLAENETLKIFKPDAKTLPWIKGMQQVAMYDIQIGQLKKFSAPLIIEMKYDNNLIKPDIALQSQFNVCYYDETLAGWIGTPFQVDEQRQVVSIKTDHLTKWSAYYTLAGYDVYPGDKCMIIYSSKDIKDDNAKYVSLTQRSASLNTVPVLVQDAALFVDQAYASYEQEGLKLPVVDAKKPESKLNVYIGNLVGSARNSKTGIISIDVSLVAQAKGPEVIKQVRQDCAHELFHEVQATRFGLSGLTALYYENKGFWLEATADYAGDVIAWKHARDRDGSSMSRTGLMGIDTLADYLKYSLFTFNKNGSRSAHDYASAHFVNFIMNKQTNAPVNVLVSMLDRDADFVKCFNDAFGANGNTLEKWLADYSYYFLFDPNGPFPKGNNRTEAVNDSKPLNFKLKNNTSGQLQENEINTTAVLKPTEEYSAYVFMTYADILGKLDAEKNGDAFDVKIKSDKEVRVVITGAEDKSAVENQAVLGGSSPSEAVFRVRSRQLIYVIGTAGKNPESINISINAKYVQQVLPVLSVDPAITSFDVGSTAGFTATVVNGPQKPYYRWNFGDGSAVEGENNRVSHTYSQPGEITGTVYLFSNDDLNTVLAQKSFRVTASKIDNSNNQAQNSVVAPTPVVDPVTPVQPSKSTQDSYNYQAALSQWVNDFTSKTNYSKRDEYWGQDHIYTLKFTIAPNIKMNGQYGPGVYGAHEIWDHWSYYTGDQAGRSGDSTVNSFGGTNTPDGIYLSLSDLRSQYPQFE